MVSTLSVTQPTSVVRSRQKLLSKRPAAINRTTVVAISTVSSVLRNAVRAWLPAAVRQGVSEEAREEVSAIARLLVDEIAGRRPASSAAPKMSAHATTSTTPSGGTFCTGGRSFHLPTNHLLP